MRCRSAVRLSAARGKLCNDSHRAQLGWLADHKVPQRWFLHFYMAGTLCNSCLLYAAWQTACSESQSKAQVLAVIDTTHRLQAAISFVKLTLCLFVGGELGQLDPFRSASCPAYAGNGIHHAIPSQCKDAPDCIHFWLEVSQLPCAPLMCMLSSMHMTLCSACSYYTVLPLSCISSDEIEKWQFDSVMYQRAHPHASSWQLWLSQPRHLMVRCCISVVL